MAEDEATDSTKVEGNLYVDVNLQDNTPAGSWVSKPVAESVTEAMEQAPVGALYELTYAVLSKRLRDILTPGNQIDGWLIGELVHTAINFRSLNPNFFTGGGRVPTVPPNSGAGSGEYHANLWGTNKDERLPSTQPLENADYPYAHGQDPTPKQDKGLLVAKLFADLQHHLPTVLFNVTDKQYVPIGIGGSAASKRFYRDGKVVTELAYKATISVEATVVTEDDEATSNLQAIVEAAFGTLRDQIGTGASITGKSFQLWLPTKVMPSPVTELEAPWSQGDDKGAKLYLATVGLQDMMFEAFTYVARPVTALLSDNIGDPGNQGQARVSLAVGDDDPEGPIRLTLGKPQRLTLSNAPVTSDLVVNQTTSGKRVVELKRPYQGSGVYEIIPRRTGEATLVLYDTGMVVPIMSADTPSTRVGSPLVQRKVVVTAC